jgi:hypothetical protein
MKSDIGMGLWFIAVRRHWRNICGKPGSNLAHDVEDTVETACSSERRSSRSPDYREVTQVTQ